MPPSKGGFFVLLTYLFYWAAPLILVAMSEVFYGGKSLG